MSFPVFASGDVLNASDMNAVGLWLVKSQAVGSGVSSVTVTGAFSANYDNYRIIYEGGVGSAQHVITVQLKVSGGSASSTGYYQGFSGYTFAGAATGAGVNNGSSFVYSGGGDTGYSHATFDLFGPFDARYTKIGGSMWYSTYAGSMAGVHAVSTSYADFIIAPNTGTLTGGTIRVYGYRD